MSGDAAPAGPRTALYLTPQGELAALAGMAVRAEALGYDSLWLPHGLGRDVLVLLTHLGAATTRLGLGSGVVPVLPRHPVALAQEALTLGEATGGRFRLGLGVSHGPVMEPAFGVAPDRPVARMREYVAALRAAFRGDGARFEGPTYRFASLLQPPGPAPALYLAALSPAMLRLAGEVADGVVLWLCPPAYIAQVARPALAEGRRRAGLGLDGFEIVAAVPLALTGRVTEAREAFRQELVRYLGFPFYRAMLAGSGQGAAVGEFEATGRVADALVDGLGHAGAPPALAAAVSRYRAAGVTLPAIRPIGWPVAPWCGPTVEAARPW